MKALLLIITIFTFSYAIDGVRNVKLNTMDASEVLQKVEQRLKKLNLKNLDKNLDYKQHISKIETLQANIKDILVTQRELREIDVDLKAAIKKYNESEDKYNKKMTKIYASNKHLQRVTYYFLSHKLDQDYLPALKNKLVDKYAIQKFDQNTEIKESSKGILSYKNVVTTNKYFGEMQVETLKDITYRDKDLNVKIIKVTQSPFVKSNESKFVKSNAKDIDKFDDSMDAEIVELTDLMQLEAIYLPKAMFTYDEIGTVMKSINSNMNVDKSNKNIAKASKRIIKAMKSVERQHDKYIKGLNNSTTEINALTLQQENKTTTLEAKIENAMLISKYYSIDLNLEELDKLIIITPKVYTAYVELGEEKDFVQRKVKSYLSKVTISELQQSETLTNYADLKTKNLSKQKLVEYESIHFFPFIRGNEFATLVFSVIELEDKVSASDFVKKDLKYSSYEFVPVKKSYKTIFASTTEVTLGTVKEFLETNRINKYFDKYCIEDSILPDGAKDFKNLGEEYYDYPAVCFKVEKVDEFMAWLAKKIGKNITFATPDEWSYVASNSNSSEFCWGNADIAELNEDGLMPENIYYENQEDTFIQPIKKFKKSLLGMYDMCGNVHELVKEEGSFMLKGNSYISFIESSNAPALEYDESLSPMVGIRAFYILEN